MSAPALATPTSPAAGGLSPLIDYVATLVAGVIVGLIGHAARKLFGISVEARHRDALHSALTTGASLALSMLAELLAQGLKPEEARSVALQAGVDYVRQSVPDAIRALKPADGLLFNMVRGKQAQLELTRRSPFVVDFGRQPTVAARG
jgi:hypothetical protein